MSRLNSMHHDNMIVNEIDKCGTFQTQALEIRLPGSNFDPNAVPTTGEEFLTLMAYERKHTPVVCVSRRPEVGNNNNIKMASSASIQKDEEFIALGHEFTAHSYDLLPSDEWKVLQIYNFECTREKINKVRPTFEVNQQIELPADGDTKAWLQFCRQNPPKLSIIFKLGQRSLEQLLDTICEWLRYGEKPFTKIETTSIDTAENVETDADAIDENIVKELNLISYWLGQWLYSTLACMHLPLEPEVHSILREIARICIRQRARLPMPEGAKDVMRYNIFIHLIAKIFRQLDFAKFI